MIVICIMGIFLLTNLATIPTISMKTTSKSGRIILERSIQSTLHDTGGYEPHDGIDISKNEDFKESTNKSGVRNPEAAGTANDPYIISGWELPYIRVLTAVEVTRIDVHFIITDCFVTGENAVQNIYFYKVRNGVIQNCIFGTDGSCFECIFIVNSQNNVIENCIISNCKYPLYLRWSDDNEVSHLDLSNGIWALRLYESNYNEIHNCSISNFEDYGLGLAGSDQNNIHHCNVLNCGKYGFYLYKNTNDLIPDPSNNNEIYKCSISGCYYYGFRSEKSCGDNVIYHNDFFENGENVIIGGNAFESCKNIWYNSTLREGNWWDDYKGSDDDRNGIGDEPYKIKYNDNEDGYPLMARYGTPYPPVISGPIRVKPFTSMGYNFTTTDQDGGEVYYYVDWGEYYPIWYGPYESGVTATIYYSWSYAGLKEIRAKATNIRNVDPDNKEGLISDWGKPLKVIAPKNKLSTSPLFLQFLERFSLLK